MRFPAAQRIRLQAEVEKIRSRGFRVHGGAFILQALRRELPAAGEGARASERPRVLVVTSRRVGPAVVRNRARRVFRVLFRRHQDLLPPGLDLMIVVRASFGTETFAGLDADFTRACGQIARRCARPAPAPQP